MSYIKQKIKVDKKRSGIKSKVKPERKKSGVKSKLEDSISMETGGEIIIYQASDKSNQIEVRMEGETIWLTIDQMAILFQKSRATINEHILNIFEEKELDSQQVMRKIGISDFSTKPTNIYNLDVIISVGYRVKSKQGTQFRIWATQRLKEYLIRGYSINENRLIKNSKNFGKLKYLITTIEEAKKEGRLKIDDSDVLMKLVSDYSKSFTLFNEIDSDSMTKEGLNENVIYEINYEDSMEVVREFRKEIVERGESNFRFGIEDDDKLKSVIGAVTQTFGGKYLYASVEEQASNLLYLIVVGHAFRDGNKRNGSLLFLWFLEKNNYRFKESGELKLNDNAIVLLSLLMAKSKGSEDRDKEFYIDLTINLLKSRRDI